MFRNVYYADFPRLGLSSRMLGFRDPFEDFFIDPLLLDADEVLGSMWDDVNSLIPGGDTTGRIESGENYPKGPTRQLGQSGQTRQLGQGPQTGQAGQGQIGQEKQTGQTEKQLQESKLTGKKEGQTQSVVERFGQDWLQSYVRAPQLEVIPKDNEFLIEVQLPGVPKEDVKVNITEDARGRKMLNICGERKEHHVQEQGQGQVTSRLYGKFSRSLLLPEGAMVDGIKAKQENGMLCITVPKVQNKGKPNAMEIDIE